MYDIVLLGATGFTGKLCAQFIAQNYPSITQWCIAGRTLSRLEAVVEELKQLCPNRVAPDIEIIELDPSSLDHLIRRTRVVINGIGPFHRFSTPIVASCATLGTHYIDFTTEVLWIQEVIERYGEVARQSGSLELIPGLSTSTPSDIIAWLIVNKMQEAYSTGTAEIISSGNLEYGHSAVTLGHKLTTFSRIKAMTAGSLNIVLDTFETYGSELDSVVDKSRNLDGTTLLAALQAVVIYTIILISPSARSPRPLIDLSIIFRKVELLVCHVVHGGIFLQEERTQMRLSWKAWVQVTSKRRAILALYLLHWAYSVLHKVPCLDCRDLGFMPAPAAKVLWQAQTEQEWNTSYIHWMSRWSGRGYLQGEFGKIRPGVVMDSRAEKWLEEADEFGFIMISTVNATGFDVLALKTLAC